MERKLSKVKSIRDLRSINPSKALAGNSPEKTNHKFEKLEELIHQNQASPIQSRKEGETSASPHSLPKSHVKLEEISNSLESVDLLNIGICFYACFHFERIN